ncbi:MAG: Gfo/Idh/MocA family oxidoreductase [Lentisphaeria bacterium]|nr:Gfo/Idh/MocA family oxidoreductase [Lentisphaeria bacterium]
MKTLKIAVVGCGSIGLRHLYNLTRISEYSRGGNPCQELPENIRKHPFLPLSLEIAALDPGAAAPSDVAAISRDIKFFVRWEDLKNFHPEIVIVATPNHLHKQNTLDALAMGAHVLCEKPIACSVADAGEMVEAAGKANRVLAVGQTERFREATAAMIRMARNGELGNLIGGRAMVGTYNTLLCAKDKKHRMENFGTIVIDYIHELDLLHAVFGPAVAAKGFFNNLSRKELQALPTLAAAVVQYQNKEVVSLHFDYVQHPQRRILELFGDKKTVVYDFQCDSLEVWDAGQDKPQVLSWNNDRNDQFVREHLDMFSAVMCGTGPQVDGKAAAEVLATAEMVLDSIQQ